MKLMSIRHDVFAVVTLNSDPRQNNKIIKVSPCLHRTPFGLSCMIRKLCECYLLIIFLFVCFVDQAGNEA